MGFIPFAENIARAKLQPLPEGWDIRRFEAVGTDAALYTFSAFRIRTRGPNVGKRKATGPSRAAVVTDAEIAAARAAFEADTGMCANCAGDGAEYAGWSAQIGRKFRTCNRCSGSGARPTRAAETCA